MTAALVTPDMAAASFRSESPTLAALSSEATRVDPRWPLLEKLAAERLGISSFRVGQRELIDAVLAGNDALGILPTGGGKSLTFQLPALVFDRPVLVVSPLIALMKDQCDHLARSNIDAAELDSTLSASEERACNVEIRAGGHPVIHVTPERLHSESCVAMLKARESRSSRWTKLTASRSGGTTARSACRFPCRMPWSRSSRGRCRS